MVHVSKVARTGAWLALSGGLLLLLPAAQREREQAKASAPRNVTAPPDVSESPGDAQVAPSGLVTKVLEPGSGTEHPMADDCVIVSFTAWRRNGLLFSTSGSNGEPATQCLAVAIPGIAEALMAMVPGEKRRAWVPSDLAFSSHGAHHGAKKMHEKPPPRLDLTLDLKLIGILKTPPVPSDLQAPPRTAFKTPLGVVLQVLQPGTGTRHPTMSSRVTVQYCAWTADGSVFESTAMSRHPAAFLVGTALPGWREALPYMVVGEKARVWIPAALAYGDQPVQKKTPAGNLVIDIELLEFE